jgi:hypothetical protein
VRLFLIIYFLVFIFIPTHTNAAGFSCDSGTLSDTCTVTSLKTIDANDIVTGSGSLVIGNGGELRVATSSSFSIEMGGDITIQSGGKISGNLYATSTNFTINIGGQINVSGKGYAGGTTGDGATCAGCNGAGSYIFRSVNSSYFGGGAGYGGNGSPAMINLSQVATSGISYGSISEPLLMGSGGGTGGSAFYAGGNGGGLVKIVSSGAVTLNGAIKADGSNGLGNSNTRLGGGGSGGSVWINAGTLSGTGSTTVNGGNGFVYNVNGFAGSGSGGRVAIYYGTDNSSITYSARGGGTLATSQYTLAGAGTIYRKQNSDTYGSLTVSNGGYYNASTTISSSLTFASTTISSGAIVYIPDSVTVDFGSSLSMSSYGNLTLSGANTIFSVDSLNVASGTSTIDVNKNIITNPNFGNITIYSGGTLSHSTSSVDNTYILRLNAENININSGGYIDVSAKGYAGGVTGTTTGTTCSDCGGGGAYLADSTGGGGAYGGNGGSGFNSPTSVSGGTSYGANSLVTLYPGSSGGGGGSSGYPGGNGGGVIDLIISGSLINNGGIFSNGGNGLGFSGTRKAGGGSGGSIRINTNILSCSGVVTANGGAGYWYNSTGFGGGGGGGRVLINYNSGSACSVLTASAGTASGAYGLATIGTTLSATLPTVTTSAASSVGASSVVLNGSISATGGANATIRGFSIGLTTSYGGTTTESGDYGVGDFSQSVYGLSCNTVYHVKSFATNSVGTGYGTDQTFTTSPCVPSISTSAASSVGTSTSVLNANISSTGGANITERGFAYGLTNIYSATTSETGVYSTGDFSTSTSNLSPNATYHFRAYAINSAGTAYGSDQQFTTSIGVPSVSTDSISGINTTSANLNATIGDLGGDVTTEVGFAYGLTSNYGATTTLVGIYPIGTFSINLSGLICNTVYHIRAHVSNSSQTGYGTDQTFTTSACPAAESNSVVRGNGMPESIRFINGINPINIIVPPKNQNVSLNNIVINQKSTNSTPFNFSFIFKKPLSKGSQNSDVKKLQEILAKDPMIYPEGKITGYFGPLTEKALIKFQIKNNIIKSSNEIGAGYFGPKTRAFLNN